jgi:hypothetical protein
MIREKVVWTIDGREVPARRDWHCSEGAPGGYDQATIYVPRTYLGYCDQGSILRAFRSSGRPLGIFKVPAPPKIRNGVAKVEGQGPQIDALTTFFMANWQSRNYGLWYPRDTDPFALSKNGGAYTIDTTSGISFTVAKDQHAGQFGSAGVVRWTPGTAINRLTFKQAVDGPSIGDNRPSDYQLRLLTYQGPNTSVNTDETDWTISDGSVIDYTLSGSPNADMVQIALRRTSASSTSTDDSLSITLTLMAVNGRALTDTMLVSEIIADLGSMAGFDVSQGIATSGVNGLPFEWSGGSDVGEPGGAVAEALDYLATLDGWRWLLQEPYVPRGYFGGLRYGPFGDAYIEPQRTWTIALEHGADESLDDIQIVNEVVQPYDLVPGIYQEAVVHADPDPLAYTAMLSPNGAIETVQQRLDKLQDQQPDDGVAQSAAASALRRMARRRVSGGIPVYEMEGYAGPVSHLELHAGDRLNLRDYQTSSGAPIGPQDVVYVDHYEDHSDAQVEKNVSVIGILARAANAEARRT